jgi:hypothetical protein
MKGRINKGNVDDVPLEQVKNQGLQLGFQGPARAAEVIRIEPYPDLACAKREKEHVLSVQETGRNFHAP